MDNNIPTLPLTVTQFNNQVKTSLNKQYQNIDVVGEINNFKKYSSGHVYFLLKDNSSQISCVMFDSYYKKLEMNLQNGEKVVLSGDATLYLPKGSYQFSAKKIQCFNQKGHIYKEYEKLKKQLDAEGLFNACHKQEIPHYPSRIGIVTSLEGAVIKDIVSIAKRRSSNVDLIVSPSVVQGLDAAKNIIRAIDKLLDYNENCNKIDFIIVARGGGSFEDLHCFNDEHLARKIFSINIPVISAIGHETDFCILDFISDLRASTPSEAIELSIPDDNEIIQTLDFCNEQMLNLLMLKINKYKNKCSLLSGSIKEFNPKLVIENYKIQLLNFRDKIISLQKNIYNNIDDKVKYYDKLLYHNNPYNILQRGFVVVTNKNDKLIKTLKDIKLNEKIGIQFQDGLALAEIQSKEQKDGK